MSSGQMRCDFSGSHALVTGGTRGIGFAIAEALAAAGASVAITGTRAAAADYDNDLSAFEYLRLDVREREAIAAVAATRRRLDILVNNAGTVFPGGRDEYEGEVFEESLRLNLASAFHLSSGCHQLLAASEQPGGASIINIASLTSWFGLPMIPGYGAAKAGLAQLGRSLAIAWAAEGVRVNAVAAGLTVTDMTAPMVEDPAMLAPFLSRTPLNRTAEPREIADAVMFLCSAAAAYITGQTLVVDGGFSISG